ncbi:MAG TPA: ribosome maturation factor RimP [Cyanothece sp. UBA12306]|nr:ribosome maturation factor RimP [Cyanothece sp. UBA12306]
MTHPLIPQIIELATPIAEDFGLEIVDAVFQTNKRPPILRIDIRNKQEDTSLDDCEKVSRALEAILDESQVMGTSYVLEISSPGISRTLNSDREFIAFKGFAVIITTYAPHLGQKQWLGRLQGRDQSAVHINQKGRAIAIPRELIAKVQLDNHR